MAGDPVNEETPYGGRCRELGLVPGPGRGMRVVLEPGSESFVDLALGPQEQDPSLQCGDLLLRDRLGNWTYQFSVVVDDFRQGVHLVVRGRDLLNSTGRQLRLARMLGRGVAPAYLHHQLIYDPSGTKISKAARDTGLRALRGAGIGPAQVLGEAAYRAGLIDHPRSISASDLPALFSQAVSPRSRRPSA